MPSWASVRPGRNEARVDSLNPANLSFEFLQPMVGQKVQDDFGQKLREARERRGLSLRQIASATKISLITLEALERNDIARLPGGIFSRAFVRSYALEVGLDPETTIQDFMGQFPQDSVTAGHPTTGRVEDHEAVESDRQM